MRAPATTQPSTTAIRPGGWAKTVNSSPCRVTRTAATNMTRAEAPRTDHTGHRRDAKPASTSPSTTPVNAPATRPNMAPKNVATTGQSIVPTMPPATIPPQLVRQTARAIPELGSTRGGSSSVRTMPDLRLV